MSTLTPEAVTWIEQSIGAGAAVVDATPLSGGISSDVMRVTVLRSGATHDVVFRRYRERDLDWVELEPDLVAREAYALEFLEDTVVSAPRLIATDPVGNATGMPALLMTMFAGEPALKPEELIENLDELAQATADVHAVPVPADGLSSYRRWGNAEISAPQPSWPGPPALLHRDLHPLNVLFQDSRVTGIVDWVNTCVGHPHADLHDRRYRQSWSSRLAHRLRSPMCTANSIRRCSSQR